MDDSHISNGKYHFVQSGVLVYQDTVEVGVQTIILPSENRDLVIPVTDAILTESIN